MKAFKKVAVLGAGTMGSAIAQHFAQKGLEVTLVDLAPAALERGLRHIKESLEEAKVRKLISEEEVQKVLGRVKMTTKQEDLKDCELLVEAVFEDLKVKQTVFAELEKHVSSDCVLASNTSSFLIAEIAQGLKNPERLVGVHYFYHAAKNKLVEVIPGPKTSKKLVQQLMNFYSFCGKTPILVKDAAGFAVNRYFVPWLNEGARLLEEGHGSIAFIDQTAKDLFHCGMGPFALMNATGVPIAQHAADGLAHTLGSFYRAAEVLRKQVASKQNWDVTDTQVLNKGSNNLTLVRERMIAATLGVAAQMVAEGVVNAAAADLGARVGLRWAKGPFELAKELGIADTQTVIDKYFKQWKMTTPQIPIKQDWIDTRIEGRSGFLVFNIPDRMNALSEEVMKDFGAKWNQMESNPQVDKIFITGNGKAFVAGADIKFFTDCIEKKDLDQIYRFTEAGQKVLNQIQSSKKKSIAYLNGLTLGGGLELALACHHRVAAVKAMMAFPETGIGIFPGLGGTQRTTRLIGKGLAKFLVSTGQFVDANTALKYGLVDQVISPVFDLSELSELDFSDRKEPVLGAFAEQAFADFDGKVTGELFEKEAFKKYEKALRFKAPVALKLAMKLMDEGASVDLDKGLQMELEHLKEIFSTKDARVGLESVLKKARPEFTGA